MKRALFALVLVLALATGFGAAAPSRAAGAFNLASETYYRADADAGMLTARVELHVQNTSTKDLVGLSVFTMPGARNVVAKKDGEPLETKPAALTDLKSGLSFGLAPVTLSKPLKTGAKTDFTVTYDVTPRSTPTFTLSAGMIEAAFVSQGPGSFVFVDVPKAGDNYFEPGCVRQADQPQDLTGGGFERWVCGEVTMAALFGDHPDVVARCASLDDACRQHQVDPLPYPGFVFPFSGFVQSLTDPSLSGTLVATVAMARGPVKVTLLYLRKDQAWADTQFAEAKQALPKLEALFGFHYPADTVLIRESTFILLGGAAGVAFPGQGEVLISKSGSIDNEVTVHELAHQWAGQNLAMPWLWEGLAEYGMRSLAPSMGITPRDWKWQSFGVTDRLATWYTSSSFENGDYWYGKAGAFWFAYEKAIGGQANMTRVLSQVGYPETPRDGRWFMDRGEEVSGAKLDALFLQWVFPDTAKPLLAERRAAHDLAEPLNARTASMGIIGTQKEISDSLEAWQFGPVADLVSRAGQILDDYTRVYVEQETSGLSATDRFGKAWSTESLKNLAAIVSDQGQAMDAIARAAKELAAQGPESEGQKQLTKARDIYTTGNFLEAKRVASGATTAQSNNAAAAKMIELAKAKQAAFSPSFISRIGLLTSDPDGQLAKAQTAAAGGDGVAALKLARSAYDAWDGATSAGLMRLAGAAALLSAGAAVFWWFRRKREERKQRGRRPKLGHVLTQDGRGSWRDWENQ